jgi:DNA sulfur modification protein DndB
MAENETVALSRGSVLVDEAFTFSLPAVRGVQAGRVYFVAMCPLGLIPKLLPAEVPGLRVPLKLQRILNRARLPELIRYLTKHAKSYILPALTVSIDVLAEFYPIGTSRDETALGLIRIPMTARLLLHDGLHRRMAIESALGAKPELAAETIAVVLFPDPGFRRAEQMFTDLKRNESHAGRSRSILGDHRDELARLVKAMVARVPVFAQLTEMSRSTISNRSAKLFTFSGIYHATVALLAGRQDEGFGSRLALAVDFWSEVAKHIPDWERARTGKVSTAELRQGYVHAHALALAALARVGKALLALNRASWRARLRNLETLEWSRANTRLWEGRAMIAGRLSKASNCVVLTGNAIKVHVGLPLTPEEKAAETRYAGRG